MLQLVATACSSQATAERPHTVCPEPEMTLSDRSTPEDSEQQIVRQWLDNAQAANVGNSGFENYTAQCRTQARTNQWQQQRVQRDDARNLVVADSRQLLVAVSTVPMMTCTDSCSGYVYVIRHIII